MQKSEKVSHAEFLLLFLNELVFAVKFSDRFFQVRFQVLCELSTFVATLDHCSCPVPRKNTCTYVYMYVHVNKTVLCTTSTLITRHQSSLVCVVEVLLLQLLPRFFLLCELRLDVLSLSSLLGQALLQ